MEVGSQKRVIIHKHGRFYACLLFAGALRVNGGKEPCGLNGRFDKGMSFYISLYLSYNSFRRKEVPLFTFHPVNRCHVFEASFGRVQR